MHLLLVLIGCRAMRMGAVGPWHASCTQMPHYIFGSTLRKFLENMLMAETLDPPLSPATAPLHSSSQRFLKCGQACKHHQINASQPPPSCNRLPMPNTIERKQAPTPTKRSQRPTIHNKRTACLPAPLLDTQITSPPCRHQSPCGKYSMLLFLKQANTTACATMATP
jgi:hypothetical protein